MSPHPHYAPAASTAFPNGGAVQNGPTVLPLDQKASQVVSNLGQAHEALTRIEGMVFGPEPTNPGGLPPMPPGLANQIDNAAASSDQLVGRLHRLAGRLSGGN